MDWRMGFHLCGVSFTLGSGLSEIYLSEPWSNRYYFFGYYSSQVARMDMKIFQVLQEVFEHFEDDHSDEDGVRGLVDVAARRDRCEGDHLTDISHAGSCRGS